MFELHLHSYGQFDADHVIGPAIWPHFDLFTVHQGRVELHVGKLGRRELSAGDAILIYPATAFRGAALTPVADASVQHFSITIVKENGAPAWVRDLQQRENGAEVFRQCGPEWLQDVDRAMRWARRGPGRLLQRTTLLALILVQVRGRRSPAGSMVPPAAEGGPLDHLDTLVAWAQDRADQPLAIADLARVAGLSEGHLRARFRAHYGESAGRFLHRLCINEAKRRLRETREPVKNIAAQLGYAEVASFHRAFQRATRSTPGDYRARATARG